MSGQELSNLAWALATSGVRPCGAWLSEFWVALEEQLDCLGLQVGQDSKRHAPQNAGAVDSILMRLCLSYHAQHLHSHHLYFSSVEAVHVNAVHMLECLPCWGGARKISNRRGSSAFTILRTALHTDLHVHL